MQLFGEQYRCDWADSNSVKQLSPLQVISGRVQCLQDPQWASGSDTARGIQRGIRKYFIMVL